jgi:hypothetical protein
LSWEGIEKDVPWRRAETAAVGSLGQTPMVVLDLSWRPEGPGMAAEIAELGQLDCWLLR